jgi:alpha-beta hydrolase superfamily lysophospholipase
LNSLEPIRRCAAAEGDFANADRYIKRPEKPVATASWRRYAVASGLIEQILEEELSETLGRELYAQPKAEPAAPVDILQGSGDEVTATAAAVTGYSNGRRER